jgi:peptide/nickel transport system permease protein
VRDLVFARIPATIELTLCAMSIAVLIAFWPDRAALLFSLLGVSMPNFWLGPVLMIVFSIQLGWLPVSGRGDLSHLILPSVTLGLAMAAILTRILRASLLQTVYEDYIRAARAKGLTETIVWLKHILRNALLSTVTILGLQFGALLAGSIITETIFAWPGIGRLTVQAIQTRDYPVVQGCVLIIATGYLLVNFLTDIFYHLVDPRITYGK